MDHFLHKYVTQLIMKVPAFYSTQSFFTPFLDPGNIFSLVYCWGLRGQMIPKPIPAVASLLVGPPTPNRPKVMTQAKKDTLVP